MKQVIVLSHFLTPRSCHRAAPWAGLGFLSQGRGGCCSVPQHRGPTGSWTYLLQLPAVSFSRRTLFIFCINYSESWAGQETGEEERRFHTTAGKKHLPLPLKHLHCQLSGGGTNKSLGFIPWSKSVLSAQPGLEQP